jgi:hypothetical protein
MRMQPARWYLPIPGTTVTCVSDSAIAADSDDGLSLAVALPAGLGAAPTGLAAEPEPAAAGEVRAGAEAELGEDVPRAGLSGTAGSAGSAGSAGRARVGAGDADAAAAAGSARSGADLPRADEPGAGEPGAGELVAGEPVAGEPAAGEVVPGKPVAGEPVAGMPAGDGGVPEGLGVAEFGAWPRPPTLVPVALVGAESRPTRRRSSSTLGGPSERAVLAGVAALAAGAPLWDPRADALADAVSVGESAAAAEVTVLAGFADAAAAAAGRAGARSEGRLPDPGPPDPGVVVGLLGTGSAVDTGSAVNGGCSEKAG